MAGLGKPWTPSDHGPLHPGKQVYEPSGLHLLTGTLVYRRHQFNYSWPCLRSATVRVLGGVKRHGAEYAEKIRQRFPDVKHDAWYCYFTWGPNQHGSGQPAGCPGHGPGHDVVQTDGSGEMLVRAEDITAQLARVLLPSDEGDGVELLIELGRHPAVLPPSAATTLTGYAGPGPGASLLRAVVGFEALASLSVALELDKPAHTVRRSTLVLASQHPWPCPLAIRTNGSKERSHLCRSLKQRVGVWCRM